MTRGVLGTAMTRDVTPNYRFQRTCSGGLLPAYAGR